MSIALGILDIVRASAREAAAEIVHSVEIEVGRLAGVEIGALEFSFDIAKAQAGLDQAELIVHEVPARCRCLACGGISDQDSLWAACPGCGGHRLEVTQGRELRVRSIEVD